MLRWHAERCRSIYFLLHWDQVRFHSDCIAFEVPQSSSATIGIDTNLIRNGFTVFYAWWSEQSKALVSQSIACKPRFSVLAVDCLASCSSWDGLQCDWNHRKTAIFVGDRCCSAAKRKRSSYLRSLGDSLLHSERWSRMSLSSAFDAFQSAPFRIFSDQMDHWLCIYITLSNKFLHSIFNIALHAFRLRYLWGSDEMRAIAISNTVRNRRRHSGQLSECEAVCNVANNDQAYMHLACTQCFEGSQA